MFSLHAFMYLKRSISLFRVTMITLVTQPSVEGCRSQARINGECFNARLLLVRLLSFEEQGKAAVMPFSLRLLKVYEMRLQHLLFAS